MRFRLGLVTGFAVGYYLGAKAGHERYEQINRALRKARRSEQFQTVTEKAKTTLDEGVGKARDLVESRDSGTGESAAAGDGHTANVTPAPGIGTPPSPGTPTPPATGYSSSR